MLKPNERSLSTLSEQWCIILPFMNRHFCFRLRTTSKSIKCSLSQHFANIFPVMSWLPKLILLMFQEELSGCWSSWALACLEQFFYRFILNEELGWIWNSWLTLGIHTWISWIAAFLCIFFGDVWCHPKYFYYLIDSLFGFACRPAVSKHFLWGARQ